MPKKVHYGLQISQQGTPLNRAADYQKVLDDRWPFLDIALDVNIDASFVDYPTASGWWIIEVARHDLGYLPAFFFREASSILEDPLTNTELVATKRAVYMRGLWISGDPTPALRLRGRLRVFACDITSEFESPIRHYAAKPDRDAEYGVKILRPGNSRIRSHDMEDFSLNTDAKALSVQKTGTAVPDGGTGHLIINHDMGYPPTYLVTQVEYTTDWSSFYADPLPADDRIKRLNNQQFAKASVTTSQLDLAGAQSALTGTYAYLIIKDPIEVAR